MCRGELENLEQKYTSISKEKALTRIKEAKEKSLIRVILGAAPSPNQRKFCYSKFSCLHCFIVPSEHRC